jgi:hypothetical protein
MTLALVVGTPKSNSGRPSESESEFRTTDSPFETTLLLTPVELPDDCDVEGGTFSEAGVRAAFFSVMDNDIGDKSGAMATLCISEAVDGACRAGGTFSAEYHRVVS